MGEIVSSKQVMDYLKRNINRKNIISMFVAGSIPKDLIPESDLDIFVVVKGKYKNEFFDNLAKIMDKFIKKNKGITYSLLRGPLKYKAKGLIHFNVYVEGGNEENKRAQFKYELNNIVKSLLKSAKIISGKSIKDIANFNKLEDKKKTLEEEKRAKERYILLKKKNYLENGLWKKDKKGWVYVTYKRHPNKYTRGYLLKYFEENWGK